MTAAIKIAKTPTTTATTTKATRKAASRRNRLTPIQRAALVVGGVGVFALGLSVIHCTQSITALTGSHWTLSVLLAVTIDAGMVTSEIAEVLVHGTKAAASVRPWCRWYIGLAVALSMALNAIGSAAHAEPSLVYGAYALGAIVPVLVFILGRVASLMWTAK